MNKESLEHFGSLLMNRVRDPSIKALDGCINHTMKGNTSKEIARIIDNENLSVEQKYLGIIPFAVDITIDYFLWLIEEDNHISLLINQSEDNCINLKEISDGLSGELYGSNGWINRFSKERNNE